VLSLLANSYPQIATLSDPADTLTTVAPSMIARASL
jgi:hypothetical protein